MKQELIDYILSLTTEQLDKVVKQLPKLISLVQED